MFLSGRVLYNRAAVTLLDMTSLVFLSLAYKHGSYWEILCVFPLALGTFYISKSYIIFFRPVKAGRLLKTKISYDEGHFSASLIFRSRNQSLTDESETVPLPVKNAYGIAYQRYVLFIYMSLLNSLSLYGRTLNREGTLV